MVTIEQLREKAAPEIFPQDVLDGAKTGLVLFAGGFHGIQDAIWFQEHDIRTTCVDIRPEGLAEMAAIYPTDWEWVVADAYDWIVKQKWQGRRWDVISIDSPTGQFNVTAGLIHLWCSIADMAVVLGCSSRQEFKMVPDGWELHERIRRSAYAGGVDWAVFTR